MEEECGRGIEEIVFVGNEIGFDGYGFWFLVYSR